MPYKNIVFVKLEKRLAADHRWYMMSEEAQLNYVRLILLAAETYNKIPKNIDALRLAFKTKQSASIIEATIREIKKNFKRFKENKAYYYFDEFDEKTNYISPKRFLRKSRGLPKEVIDKEKSRVEKSRVDKSREEKRESTRPTKVDVDNYFKELECSQEAAKFYDHFESNGWKVGGKAAMKDWKAAARNWKRRGLESGKIVKQSADIRRGTVVIKCSDCETSHDVDKDCPNPECPTKTWTDKEHSKEVEL